MAEWRSVRLPESLCAQAETRCADRFGCVEELLMAFLQEFNRDESGRLEKEEEQILERRLKDLGYI